ncbi:MULTISPECIES: adenylate/guanylate cyclase domain-containing protein [unclassified Fibrobacter]|uniref:adenylate/guanylate cyclase domain-containing protein n=1 Tax=unclassified Fibrobacter TaxID=2634177 RepID=UPI001304E7D5|nr:MULTISPECIES: adenylate/guanylate cyclase domain-containing protein [unclassified Fibrobacter]
MIFTLSASALLTYGAGNGFDSSRMLFMLQLSLLIGLSHAIYDVMILQDEMDKRPVAAALLIRSWFFIASICANLILCILIWDIDRSEGLINEAALQHVLSVFKQPKTHILIFELFMLGNLITFVRSVHKKFGTRVFMNTLLGKNQEPKEEDLVFMFIDMKHSTEIAEELGHVKYSNFIRDYYRLLSNCCEENHGEIYQIAGDGAFLTWKISDCRKKARPIDCFYDFAECLERTAYKFKKRYGIVPEFKAAAHCGKVISTEVGNFGSEMAYHGDVLNTTSRIQTLCSKLGQDFLISEDLYIRLPLPLPHGFLGVKAGFFELRGKKNGILIFSLHKPLT